MRAVNSEYGGNPVRRVGSNLVCADIETEKRAQTVRMVAWAFGGPSLIYLASKTPKNMPGVRTFLFVSGAACAAWHFSVWKMVNDALKSSPREE